MGGSLNLSCRTEHMIFEGDATSLDHDVDHALVGVQVHVTHEHGVEVARGDAFGSGSLDDFLDGIEHWLHAIEYLGFFGFWDGIVHYLLSMC